MNKRSSKYFSEADQKKLEEARCDPKLFRAVAKLVLQRALEKLESAQLEKELTEELLEAVS